MTGKTMDKGKQIVEGEKMFLEELTEGSSGPIEVMFCRRFDVNNINGRYMSTDFIVCDSKGGIMHCSARNNIAHVFVDKIHEGSVYRIKGFTVQIRDTYRLMKDSQYVIQLQGNTVVRKVNDPAGSFERHPFVLTAFEELEATGNKYFVDVIGYVTAVDEPSVKSNGARTVEFNLINERKRQVRVTLWGDLGDAMIKKKAANPDMFFLILTSMSAKPYMGNICLSSTSSSMLIDSASVPVLNTFKNSLSCVQIGEYNEPITEDMPEVKTLSELLERSRDPSRKGSVVFRNTVEITGVRTKNSWFVFTCSGGKCRKGVTREGGVYKCRGCKTKVDYPRTRFRLQLDVHDGTMTTVVVCFDETAEKLVHRTAKSLLEDQHRDDTPDVSVLPPAVEALIGTKQLFEIKSHTYYHFGDYESFNCAKVILPDDDSSSEDNLAASEKVGLLTSADTSLGSSKSRTPVRKRAKRTKSADKTQEPKRRKLRIQDLDTDELEVVEPDTNTGVQKHNTASNNELSGSDQAGIDNYEE